MSGQVPMMPTQKARILEALQMRPRCSLSFLDWQPRITRAAARVQELRDAGHQIVSTPCQMHARPTAPHVTYELVTTGQMELLDV